MSITLRRTGRPAGRIAVVAAAAALASTAATLLAPTVPHAGPVVRPESPQVRIVKVTEPVGATAAGVLRARRLSTSGYVPSTSGLIGHTPRGLAVWVNPTAKHRADIVKNTKAAVALWRSLGINARYRGLGTPKAAEGIITVAEGPAGCQGGSNRVGNAWQSWMPLPDGKRYYVHSGRVVICPKLYTYASWQWSATVRHELGHAAGLGHFDGVYQGSTQVMRSQNSSGVATFQAGDINGLKFYASNNAQVRSLISPDGRFTGSSMVGGDVRMTGYAKLAYYPDRRVKIVVTDNDKPLLTTTTRADGTFVVTTPWKGGSHQFCITAISPVNAAARDELGCTSWAG